MYLIGTFGILAAIVLLMGSVVFVLSVLYISLQAGARALVQGASSLAAKVIESDLLREQPGRLIAYGSAFRGTLTGVGQGLSSLARKGSMAAPRLMPVPSESANPQRSRP
jgi:hypothetical protein